jgi:DNA-binding NtrC family response regulator
VKRALEKQRSRESIAGSPTRESEALIGTSPVMQELFKKIAVVAATGVPVLSTGEAAQPRSLTEPSTAAAGGRRVRSCRSAWPRSLSVT